MHGKDLGRPAGLAHYAERRFTRICPLYWVALLVTLAMVALSFSRSMPETGFILYSLTLMPHAGDAIVGVSWTLQHEMLFYLIFAIAIIHAKLGAVIFVFWFLLIAAAWAFGFKPVESAFFDRLSSAFNLEFFLGMMAAYLVRTYRMPKPRLLLTLGTLVFLGFGIAENIGAFDGYATPARLAYGIGSMLMVLGLAGQGQAGESGIPSPFVILGTASYAIYLFHLIVIGIVYKCMSVTGLLKVLPVWLIYLVLSAAGIIGGMLISRFVEYPLMGQVRRVISRRSRQLIDPA